MIMADDKNKSTQAERLVQLRRDKGLTAEQLAQAMTAAGAKVSRGAISNWERGTNGIVSSKLPTLAHILGCSEGYLLRGELKNDSDNNKEVSKSAHSHNKNSQNMSFAQTDKIHDSQANQTTTTPTIDTNSPNNPMSGHAMNTIKNRINCKMFATTFAARYYKQPIKWKQKANVY